MNTQVVGMAQVVESLLSKRKALSSNPSNIKKKKKRKKEKRREIPQFQKELLSFTTHNTFCCSMTYRKLHISLAYSSVDSLSISMDLTSPQMKKWDISSTLEGTV
jgi:hypothetical protein